LPGLHGWIQAGIVARTADSNEPSDGRGGNMIESYTGYTVDVGSNWIDVNGHMNASFYYLLFYDAGIAFATHIGLGLEYPKRHGKGQAVVESHTRFEGENLLDDKLQVRSMVTNFDKRRIHFYHEMHNLTRGCRSATLEQLEFHIDLSTRKVTEFSQALLDNFAAITAIQGPLPSAGDIGRQVKFGRSSA
jgi:acyl-CoA thioester hydrolase